MTSTLRELLIIREHNRAYIDSITHGLGSALGLKNGDGDPCIIVFVPQKINKKWLPSTQIITNRLETPDGLYCPVDVVEGGKYNYLEDVKLLDITDAEYFGSANIVTRQDLLGPPALSSDSRTVLLEKLRGWTETVMPGAQLFHANGWYGTLACFAKDRSGKLGFITNQHVAGNVNDLLLFPAKGGVKLGRVVRTVTQLPDEIRFPGLVDEPVSSYVVDCAFVELLSDFKLTDIEPRLPVIDDEDKIDFVELGDPLPLDLDTLGPLGIPVVGIGRTRSFQKGTISAFAYSWDVDRWSNPTEKQYTDYLVIGEEGEEFSDSGDSGKLIVTADQYRPVALLWGGWRERLRHSRMQENWTYAIEIGKVLEQLNVSISRSLNP